jgi:hypothetical protein
MTFSLMLESVMQCREEEWHDICDVNINISWMQQMRHMGSSHGLPDCMGNYFSTRNLQKTRKYTPQVGVPLHILVP